METARDIFFLLMLNATLGQAAIAWVLQLVHNPLFIRLGRRRFTPYVRTAFSILLMLTAPLMLVELLATIGFAVLLPARIHPDLAWAGLLLLAVVWGVTLHHHRPAVRSLSREFDPAVFRKLLCAQWVRTFAWSFRAVIVLMMMLRLLDR